MNDTIDRAKLIAWLLDKARDEEETASHVRATIDLGALEEVLVHEDRARLMRGLAVAIENEEPDHFSPPDLTTERRRSGEFRFDTIPAPRSTKPNLDE